MPSVSHIMPFFNPPQLNIHNCCSSIFFLLLSNCCHRWAFILCCQPGQILLEHPQNPYLPPGSVFLSEQVGAISLISMIMPCFARESLNSGVSCRQGKAAVPMITSSKMSALYPQFSVLPPCLPSALLRPLDATLTSAARGH